MRRLAFAVTLLCAPAFAKDSEPPRTLAEAELRLSRAAATVYDPKALYHATPMSAELTAIIAYLKEAGDAPTDLRDALVMLGLNEQKRGHDDVAKQTFAEAFDIRGAAPQTPARATYDHHAYADLLRDAGDAAVAVDQYLISLDAMAQSGAAFSWDQRLGTIQDLAYVLHEAGRYEEALARNRQCIEGGEALYGRDDPRLYSVVLNAAQNLHALQRKTEAEPYLIHALEIARKDNAPLKQQDILFQLGVLSFELGRYDDARRYMKERLDFVATRAPDKLADARADLDTLESKILGAGR